MDLSVSAAYHAAQRLSRFGSWSRIFEGLGHFSDPDFQRIKVLKPAPHAPLAFVVLNGAINRVGAYVPMASAMVCFGERGVEHGFIHGGATIEFRFVAHGNRFFLSRPTASQKAFAAAS